MYAVGLAGNRPWVLTEKFCDIFHFFFCGKVGFNVNHDHMMQPLVVIKCHLIKSINHYWFI